MNTRRHVPARFPHSRAVQLAASAVHRGLVLFASQPRESSRRLTMRETATTIGFVGLLPCGARGHDKRKSPLSDHPDVRYRVFEHGLVLPNPSDHPFAFHLNAIIPEATFTGSKIPANRIRRSTTANVSAELSRWDQGTVCSSARHSTQRNHQHVEVIPASFQGLTKPSLKP
jgi:hypothetical protein